MRKGVYTINQLILPDESTVLPKGQKTICGNKTIIKMEKGEYIDNDLLYQNLAKKYKRDFRMDNILDKTLIDISSLFKAYLEGKKISDMYLESKIKNLISTNLLVYKELGLLFNECFNFLIKKRDFDINMFKHYHLYQPYLSEDIQYVFNYTTALYCYHYQDNAIDINEFKYIIERQFIHIMETNNKIGVQNEWVQASLYADIGFTYALKSQYHIALNYFQKASNIHPCTIAKYLPAYYICILITKTNPSHFMQNLNRLPSHFKEHIHFLNLVFNENEDIKKYLNKKSFSKLTKSEEKIYLYFSTKFILSVLRKKKKLH